MPLVRHTDSTTDFKILYHTLMQITYLEANLENLTYSFAFVNNWRVTRLEHISVQKFNEQ